MTTYIHQFLRDHSGDSQAALNLVQRDLERSLVGSLDALDCAEELLLAAGNIGAAGRTIWDHPRNALALSDARSAARKVLRICDRIEEIV